ncbi:MAG: cytochrome c oxidase subunit 3 [Terriglobales bacterium]
MTEVFLQAPPHIEHAGPPVRRIDDRRGTFGMVLFIATEATLFVMLFMAYFYVAKGGDRWKTEEAPKLHYSLPMLGVLLTSSVVLHWGEKQLKEGKYGLARAGLIGTIALGILFLGLSYLDYAEHLLHLTPQANAYGSIFYTITSLHVAHVITGLLMMGWLLLVAPHWEPAQHTPHRPYHNVSMYWHFVDTVWVFIIAILYVSPHFL